LGFLLLDSGVLYRILGIAVLKGGVNLEDIDRLTALALQMDIEFGPSGLDSVTLDGEDVSLEIRTDIGSQMASKVGAIPAARNALFKRQLAFRKPPGLVADGRDMGAVVFPDAAVKIFLTASAEERAQRRYKQLIGKGIDATLPDLLQELRERDKRDSQREISPLKPAEDATILDTTHQSIDEVVNQVMAQCNKELGMA
jgi:cytidylate kinase